MANCEEVRFGIKEVIKGKSPLSNDPAEEVTLTLSDVWDLAETIRSTTLEMQKAKRRYEEQVGMLPYELEGLEQGINRLENLYKELTGKKLNEMPFELD